MSTFDHFAYGSNLSLLRIRQRCPSATPLAVGFVRCRQLRFHKIGRDGTGKADAYWTGNQDDIVWGVIYRSALPEKCELDRCESLGNGYEEAAIEVHVGARRRTTFLYQAMSQHIDTSLIPASWYFDHVIRGARQHALPPDYQRVIATFDPLGGSPLFASA